MTDDPWPTKPCCPRENHVRFVLFPICFLASATIGMGHGVSARSGLPMYFGLGTRYNSTADETCGENRDKTTQCPSAFALHQLNNSLLHHIPQRESKMNRKRQHQNAKLALGFVIVPAIRRDVGEGYTRHGAGYTPCPGCYSDQLNTGRAGVWSG